jgi:hypothetical protein
MPSSTFPLARAHAQFSAILFDEFDFISFNRLA